MSIRIGQVSESAAPWKKKCSECNRVFKDGQHFMEVRIPSAPIVERFQAFHVQCVRTLIDDVPPDEDLAKQQFEELRAKILAAQTIFPD